MTALIVFLFILQLLSFFLIAILYLRLGKVNQVKHEQNAIIREMEDAVGAYLLEIKDENDRLLSELSRIKPSETSKSLQENRIEATVDLPVIPTTPKSKAVHQYKQAAPQQIPETKQLSKEEKALDLSQNGYSIEEIAKRLNMGKTEVELLLKFRG